MRGTTDAERYKTPEALERARESRRKSGQARDRATQRLVNTHREEYRLLYAEEAQAAGLKIIGATRKLLEKKEQEQPVTTNAERRAERAERDAQRAEALAKIKDARALVAEAEDLVADAVAEARMYGCRWDDIAALFPVSRSTVVRLYDPEAHNDPDIRTDAQAQAQRRARIAR